MVVIHVIGLMKKALQRRKVPQKGKGRRRDGQTALTWKAKEKTTILCFLRDLKLEKGIEFQKTPLKFQKLPSNPPISQGTNRLPRKKNRLKPNIQKRWKKRNLKSWKKRKNKNKKDRCFLLFLYSYLTVQTIYMKKKKIKK